MKNNIRDIRKKLKLSQEDLANKCGVQLTANDSSTTMTATDEIIGCRQLLAISINIK